jgi:hypothetical protein
VAVSSAAAALGINSGGSFKCKRAKGIPFALLLTANRGPGAILSGTRRTNYVGLIVRPSVVRFKHSYIMHEDNEITYNAAVQSFLVASHSKGD